MTKQWLALLATVIVLIEIPIGAQAPGEPVVVESGGVKITILAEPITVTPPVCSVVKLGPITTTGTVGTVYTQIVVASGGTPPYLFTVTTGALPAGLTLTSGGLLVGTPTAAAVSTVTITAVDSKACAGAQAYTLTITNPTGGGGIAIEPGQTINTIVSAAPVPSTFLLKAGVHRMQTISPRTGDTFTGEAGTILSGARVLTNPSGSGPWAYGGQTQEGVYDNGGGQACMSGHQACGNAEDLFIDNVLKEHVSTKAEGVPGKWWFDYPNDTIYIWDNPAGHTVETSVTPAAFTIGAATGVTIKNLIIEKFASVTHNAAVSLGAGWIISGAEVRWNHYSGIETLSGSIARGNKVHHNGAFGFTGSGGNALVENNEIAYNNTCFANPFWGAGGSKWVYTDGLVVRGNFSHHNIGPGLWTDINNINTLYENNTLEDNTRAGIFHEISYKATIRNNTVRRNGTSKVFPGWPTEGGIATTSSRDVEIYGNTLVDNWGGIGALQEERYDLPPLHGSYEVINLNVHDNTVTTGKDGSPGLSGVVHQTGPSPWDAAHNNKYEGNHYTLGSNANYFQWQVGGMNEGAWQAVGNDSPNGSFVR